MRKITATFWQTCDQAFGKHRLWLPLALAYLFINLSSIDDGGTAAMARFATMRAMAEQHTFRIDRYADWTIDWAKTPDGHFFSNKAPGPTLIAFPVFWIVDTLLSPLQEKHLDEKGRKQAPRGLQKVLITTIFQVIPFLLISLLLLHKVFPDPVNPSAYAISAICLLFGNTAAALMNSYMGNPFAALTFLGVIYFYLIGNVFWSSCFFGWTVLSEYGAAPLVLPFAWLMWQEARRASLKIVAAQVLMGAALPAMLWVWYHSICFGGPLQMPFYFEIFTIPEQSTSEPAEQVLGFTSLLANGKNLVSLLIGPSRGILFTQPWMLVTLVLSVFYFRKLPPGKWRDILLFASAAFLICLWFTAGFQGWHGGGAPGPRYLAVVLPPFALILALIFEPVSRLWRGVLWATAAIAVVLRGLIYATWILPPVEPLWPYYLGKITSFKEYRELLQFLAITVIAGFYLWRRSRELRQTKRTSALQ